MNKNGFAISQNEKEEVIKLIREFDSKANIISEKVKISTPLSVIKNHCDYDDIIVWATN